RPAETASVQWHFLRVPAEHLPLPRVEIGLSCCPELFPHRLPSEALYRPMIEQDKFLNQIHIKHISFHGPFESKFAEEAARGKLRRRDTRKRSLSISLRVFY